MNDRLDPNDVDSDVLWARDRLGPSNPVPAPDAVNPPRPGLVAALVATTSPDASWAPTAPPARRRAAVATALVATAALIAGVVGANLMGTARSGHGPVGATGGQAVFAAAAVTQAGRTAQVRVAVSVGGTTTTGQGAADLSTGAADFTADLPAFGSVEVRTIGTAAYVRLPSGLQGLAGGRPWIKADLSTIESIAGQQLGAPSLGGGFDGGLGLTGVLDWLRGVSGQVTTVGTNEIVHGDATTHYRAMVDPAKAAANAPAAIRSRLGAASLVAGPSVPVDVWIDAQGRLRRLTASVDPSQVVVPTHPRSVGSGPVVVTVELWGFGSAVSVSAPPADQVSDMGSGSGLLGSVAGLRGLRGSSPSSSSSLSASSSG